MLKVNAKSFSQLSWKLKVLNDILKLWRIK